MKRKVLLVVCLIAVTSSSMTSARKLDLQDPAYQQQMEEYMKARELAKGLILSLKKGQSLYKQPFSPQRYIPDLEKLIDSLDLMLAPETKRRQTLIIKPESLFFKPINPKD